MKIALAQIDPIVGDFEGSLNGSLEAPLEFRLVEEISEFALGRLRAVRTVSRVGFDRIREILTDRARCSFRWIGCAHDFTICSDGVFAFETHKENGTRGHEVHERTEERTLFMLDVETFRFFAGEFRELSRRDAETILLEAGDDSPMAFF